MAVAHAAFADQPYVLWRTFVEPAEFKDARPRPASVPPFLRLFPEPGPPRAAPRWPLGLPFPEQPYPVVRTLVEHATGARARRATRSASPRVSGAPVASPAESEQGSAPPHEPGPDPADSDPGAVPDRIRQQGLTTLRVRNLASRSRITDLFAHLDHLGFAECYDFVHFVPNSARSVHRDYAFVVFQTPEQCARCAQALDGTQLRVPARSPIRVEPAEAQGVAASLAAWPGPGAGVHHANAEFCPWIRIARSMVPLDYARRALGWREDRAPGLPSGSTDGPY